jgi:hypothetical protein
MKIYKLYESIISESEITSCVKKFGYELFGDELGGSEKNTGIENQYVRDIADFTDNMYGEETTPEFVSAMKNLKSCMRQYPDVLIPDKAKVYRGITIPLKYFVDTKQVINLTTPNPYVYKASSKIQSWSTDFEIASTFGNHDTLNELSNNIDFSELNTPKDRRDFLLEMIDEDLRIAFILEYSTNPNEFIFKAKYFKILSIANDEDEIIRIDNKPINVSAWFNNDGGLTKKSLETIKYLNIGITEL